MPNSGIENCDNSCPTDQLQDDKDPDNSFVDPADSSVSLKSL